MHRLRLKLAYLLRRLADRLAPPAMTYGEAQAYATAATRARLDALRPGPDPKLEK